MKTLLPLAIIAVGAAGLALFWVMRDAPETAVPEPPVPLVRVEPVERADVRMTVRSQGTVTPRTESALVAEVPGRVIEVSRSFTPGGFFDKGEVLLRLDAHDYRQALVQARSEVARADLRLAQEQAEAEVARREWQELGGGDASPLTLREPQVAEAQAALEAARAAIQRAERDLARTELRAPYEGRVRDKRVDVGQYVSPGASPLATIYAVDYAEIRLPLANRDLAFIDIPLDYSDERAQRTGPEVALSAEFAGRRFDWTGHVVRTEGEIDARSRMVHVVARVRDPYARGDQPDRPPLAVGLFVEAEIRGHLVEDVAVIPRSAIRPNGQVLVVDSDNRLRFRDIEVVRLMNDTAIVRAGLEQGERLCVTTLAVVTDGMQVRTIDSEEVLG